MLRLPFFPLALARRPLPLGVTAGFALVLAALTPRLSADVVEKDGKVHVTYWEKWVSFEGVAMQASVDAFNRSQDKIEVEYFPTSEIDRKALVAIAGGDPPDVAGLWVQNIATYADAEGLMPLDDFIRRDGLTTEAWLARYYPIFAQICSYRGKIYAGISTPNVLAFHWNKTLFREAGLDPDRPPRTFAELEEYSKKLTKRDPKTGAITQMGFLLDEPGWWPWLFAEWFGGVLFDGREITCGTDPKVLEMMTWAARDVRDYGVEQVQTFYSGFSGKTLNGQSAFMNGKVAIMPLGVWFDNYLNQYKPGLDYGVGSWPEKIPGIRDFTMAEADVLTIPRGAKNPNAAWEFIKYVNSSNPHARSREELQGIELTCFLQAKNSPLRSWSPFFEQHHPHPYIRTFRELSASPHAVCVPQMGIWQAYHREFTAAFQAVRRLAETPEKSLAYCQKRMGQSWGKYLKSLERHGQVAPTGVVAAP